MTPPPPPIFLLSTSPLRDAQYVQKCLPHLMLRRTSACSINCGDEANNYVALVSTVASSRVAKQMKKKKKKKDRISLLLYILQSNKRGGNTEGEDSSESKRSPLTIRRESATVTAPTSFVCVTEKMLQRMVNLPGAEKMFIIREVCGIKDDKAASSVVVQFRYGSQLGLLVSNYDEENEGGSCEDDDDDDDDEDTTIGYTSDETDAAEPLPNQGTVDCCVPILSPQVISLITSSWAATAMSSTPPTSHSSRTTNSPRKSKSSERRSSERYSISPKNNSRNSNADGSRNNSRKSSLKDVIDTVITKLRGSGSKPSSAATHAGRRRSNSGRSIPSTSSAASSDYIASFDPDRSYSRSVDGPRPTIIPTPPRISSPTESTAATTSPRTMPTQMPSSPKQSGAFQNLRISLMTTPKSPTRIERTNVTPNNPISYPISSELFSGQVMIFLRDSSDDSKMHHNIFTGKQRKVEIQVQGKFLRKLKSPTSRLFLGGEVTSPMVGNLGVVTRGVCGVLLAFVKRLNAEMHYSFGVLDSEKEKLQVREKNSNSTSVESACGRRNY